MHRDIVYRPLSAQPRAVHLSSAAAQASHWPAAALRAVMLVSAMALSACSAVRNTADAILPDINGADFAKAPIRRAWTTKAIWSFWPA